MRERSLVSIVDDDESVRESLPDLLRQFGFAAEAFSSAEAFLKSDVVSETSCLLIDIAMPGMSGPDVLIAIGAIPATRVIVPLVSEAHGNAVSSERPHFLDESVVELPAPFTREERDDFASTGDEL
jgi:FixJ family two-component response regulator